MHVFGALEICGEDDIALLLSIRAVDHSKTICFQTFYISFSILFVLHIRIVFYIYKFIIENEVSDWAVCVCNRSASSSTSASAFIFHAFSHTVSMSFTATTQSMFMPNALLWYLHQHIIWQSFIFRNVKTTDKKIFTHTIVRLTLLIKCWVFYFQINSC